MAKNIDFGSVPEELTKARNELIQIIESFIAECKPLEAEALHVLVDRRTGAFFCECHIKGDRLINLGTIDVPLDPDEQAEYRANRELVEDHIAYRAMTFDAKNGRSFSNIVAEYSTRKDEQPPLKIIGGQHRFEAIKGALVESVNEYHGIKVYFELDTDQRLDVQLISNTNIEVSPDLLDRMYETVSGPELRNWCQEVEFLDKDQDFADRRKRGVPITVRAVRTFILNYFEGKKVEAKRFDETKTTPLIVKTGVNDLEWNSFKSEHQDLWTDKKLKTAGQEFAHLIEAQRNYFEDKNDGQKINVDFGEKALNYAVLSAWAFTAGLLSTNNVRLKRHFELRKVNGRDPLNASMLAKGRHKSDSDNYRGLGYRTDSKERGRFVELFFAQTEKGGGITKTLIDLAIKKYHAKQALLDVKEVQNKA